MVSAHNYTIGITYKKQRCFWGKTWLRLCDVLKKNLKFKLIVAPVELNGMCVSVDPLYAP